MTGWLTSISVALSSPHLGTTVLLGRFAFAFAATMPFVLLCLVLAFRSDRRRLLQTVAVPGILWAFFVIASFTPWIVASAEPGRERPNFIYGFLHPPFGVYLLGCFLYALLILWREIRRLSGLRKLQLQYLFVGALIAGSGIIVTNLIIPLVWRTSRYSVVGPYFTLVFLSFSAHAIVRHRLMDIRVVVRQGVVYGSAIAITAMIFLGLSVTTQQLAGYTSETIPLTAAVVIAIFVALFFQPTKERIQRSLNRYVYRQSYDYHRTLREGSRRLSTLLDLHSLLSHLIDVIDLALNPEVIAVYLADARGFQLTVYRTATTPPVPALARDAPLVTTLTLRKRPLVVDRTLDRSEQTAEAHQLLSLTAEIALPLLDDGKLAGIVVLGPKRAGDAYFADDIELIATLASQASIAIKNAQLYREVLVATEYIENIVRAMESAVVAVTSDGVVTLFNSAAERLTGIAVQKVKGAHLLGLPPTIATALQATLKTGHYETQVETAIRGTEGSLTPVVYSTSPLRDRAGVVLGAVAVFSDLTRVKELEADKRRTERLASIGAFAARIAHEIKNPLVAIKTFAELLPERFTEEDFRLDFSKVVISEIDRIDDLVGRLRGFATPETRHLAPVMLHEPISETLALLRGQLEQSRISVTAHYEPELPMILGDAAQLKQLLLNLLLNAIDAMPDGGTLALALKQRDTIDTSLVVLEITDSGAGIPAHLLQTVFDPFVTTKPQGSGLGLSICKGIADAHRATIRIDNNTRAPGTTAVVEFPALSAPSTVPSLSEGVANG
jgi:PAS domain S-box-containing protein